MRAALVLAICSLCAGSVRAGAPGAAAAPSAHAAPGAESGRIDAAGGDPEWRVLARGALFLPKILFEVATAPARGVLWLYDRYQIEERLYRTFCSEDRSLCVVPVADYLTGFGGTVGARLDVSNGFGAHEHARLQVTGGFGYRASVAGMIDTGRRLGPLRLELDAGYERRPEEVFFGIGNADLAAMPPPAPVDPLANPLAVETHYRLSELRAAAVAELTPWRTVHLVASAAFEQLHATPATDDTPIETVYEPAGLVGFDVVRDQVVPRLELRWNGRSRGSPWEPRPLHAIGSLVRVYAGRVIQLGHGDFWYYGGELQHFWRLGMLPRVLAVRLFGEGVTGTLDAVPFYDLPMLGGDAFLRGYDYGRFRDRIAAVGSIQYLWDVSRYVDAYTFVDVGRVYRDADDLGLDHLRVGYGLGLQLHSDGGFLGEVMIASSIDGGITLALSLNPAFDRSAHWR